MIVQIVATVVEIKKSREYNSEKKEYEERNVAKIEWMGLDQWTKNSFILENNNEKLKFGDSVRVIVTSVSPLTPEGLQQLTESNEAT